MRITHLLLEDLRVNWYWKDKGTPTKRSDIWRSLFDPRFAPIVLIRLAHKFANMAKPYRILGLFFSLVNRLVFGVECAHQTSIKGGLYLPHPNGIVIGAFSIGKNCTIFQQVTLGATEVDMCFSEGKRPKLGDNVFVGAGAKVLGGLVLHDECKVGANAVVLRDVEQFHTVGGVPAKILGTAPRSG
jgi:serine O-acetyltransferase